jgi:hypothetical protein
MFFSAEKIIRKMRQPISLKEEHKQRDAADESHRAVNRSRASNM